MPDASEDIPNVLAPPPLIYGLPLLAGLLLQLFRPFPLLTPFWGNILGPLFVVLGLVGLPAVLAFQRAGTHPQPWRPATALVTTGPYRFSRNPMYLGFTLLYLGTSLWVNTVWPILALPLVLVMMQYGVVMREEAYMERRFGDAYRCYRDRVRRWV